MTILQCESTDNGYFLVSTRVHRVQQGAKAAQECAIAKFALIDENAPFALGKTHVNLANDWRKMTVVTAYAFQASPARNSYRILI
jgi:hypothetical protein